MKSIVIAITGLQGHPNQLLRELAALPGEFSPGERRVALRGLLEEFSEYL